MSNDEQLLAALASHTRDIPTSTSGAVDWINDARMLLEAAADVIEHLATKRDELTEACEALALLNDILVEKANIEHVPDCDREPGEWITTGRFACRGCELEALIRFVGDYEQLPDWPNAHYLAAARNVHIPHPN